VTFIDAHPMRGAFAANTIDRLVNLIMEQGQELLREAGVGFPSRAASTVLLLGERGQLSAAEIAKELGQPHQLATQRIDLLIDLGIVARVSDPDDARRKVLSLTANGKKQFQRLKKCLVRAELVFAELFAEIGCDLSAVALRAMDALNGSSIASRARAQSLKSAA
jgi:DNA-binding MarR family transcriptional regulator